MEDLICFVNKLQDVFNLSGCGSMGIDLPQVVVVGAQSSGKSSVLENLVGQSFLPRGPGLVTRCPLVLQMMKVKSGEYGIFDHKPDEQFKDFKRITQEIENQTKRLAGDYKGICSTPITLKLYSTSFINLTLVDLPGLTKVSIGDQPPDIERQITDLIMSYVTNKKSLILAITPANTDLATSDSLKISREVDPEGKRTLAVLTKLDLVDKGTDATKVLQGDLINVKLGIIGVVNRSHKDLLEDKSISDSLSDETKFFNNHYKNIASKQGTHYLRKTVQQILINHIKECLPEVRVNINNYLANAEKELSVVGNSKLDQSALLLDLLTKYDKAFCSVISGNSNNIDIKRLCGGARIKSFFDKVLVKNLNLIKVEQMYNATEILYATANASGVDKTLFAGELAFKQLVKKPINEMQEPCLDCVRFVHAELGSIAKTCLEDPKVGIKIYPKLQTIVDEAVEDLLRENLSLTLDKVQSFIEMQVSYINTSHPDFVPNVLQYSKKKDNDEHIEEEEDYDDDDYNRRTIRQVNVPLSRSLLQKTTKDEVSFIESLMQSYFFIVKKIVEDTVPKTIMHNFVNFICGKLYKHLVENVFLKNDPKYLLEEASEITEKREKLLKKISALKEAKKLVNALALQETQGPQHALQVAALSPTPCQRPGRSSPQ